jgi:glutamate-1-semialdehyde aminotransferase
MISEKRRGLSGPGPINLRQIAGPVERGVLMTPFHNMALMSPAHTLDDVKRHTEHFSDAVKALFA